MHSANVATTFERDCSVTSIFRSRLSPTPVPMALESVHAGFPSVAQDYFAGDFSFDEQIITHPDTTFIITVAGDSMEGAGIWDGDLLVVDRSLSPEDGDVVLAVLDDELTVKRLLLSNQQPILHAENPNYPDFTSYDASELRIWGVVVGNFHQQRRHTKQLSTFPTHRQRTAVPGTMRPTSKPNPNIEPSSAKRQNR